ncbi:hypothetical protein DASC09_003510 [Saccharomycopsis crataegensis]|uniref:Peptidase M20 dimerisation domain-containing protein n=1 Tax=Saccharomycopsis crataegensis TaxID=43959 RepID=A0AAV5QED4_9ASCO|nr:hypothetical protein DASC09_003510 [Saccharomycopsis crataegensis]
MFLKSVFLVYSLLVLRVYAANIMGLSPFKMSVIQPLLSSSKNSQIDCDHHSVKSSKRWDVVDMLKAMAKIDSTVGYEYEVMHWLRDVLEEQGMTVEMQLVEDEHQSVTGLARHNIYAYMGKTRDTSIVVSSHIDTNPEGNIPYHEIGEEIHVRGACDAKGPAAGQIVAFFELWDASIIKEGDVSLLFVIGEEYNGIGMKTAVESLNATWSKAAIFGEPTENKLSKGHKGNFRFDVEAWGKKSHSGYPELGFSAIEFYLRKANTLLNAELPYSPVLGPTTVNIGTIHGGVAANIIPDYVKAEMYIRVADDIEKVKAYVEELFNTEHSQMTIVQYLKPQYLSFDVPGFELIACAYATDIPYFESIDVKKYLYGPGSISVAHTQAEFVTVTDLYDSVIGYKNLITYNL